MHVISRPCEDVTATLDDGGSGPDLLDPDTPSRPADPDVTAVMARMHAEGISLHTTAAALDRSVGRRPNGVPRTSGAVARGLAG